MTFEPIRDDLRYALRTLRKAPGFTLAGVITFALGIGANATMFGIIDRLLLRPPAHVTEPGRVTRIGLQWVSTGQPADDPFFFFSYPSYKALRDDPGPYERVAVMSTPTEVPIGSGAGALKASGLLVSASYFSTLGVRPALGRFFLAEEDAEPSGALVAVISHGLWQRAFGGVGDVLGKTLDIGARRFTIVGVTPQRFTGLWLGAVDVWIPITASDGLRFLGADWAEDRGSTWVHIFGRLRPGATPPQAAAHATAAFRTVASARRLETAEPRAVALPVRSAWINDRGDASDDIRVAALLGGVSVLVLIIACANVANLMLARALRRRREIAVRLALGVARRRLAAQLVTESLLVALIGGVAAIAAARWGGEIVRVAFFGDIEWAGSAVDARVIAFAAIATVMTGVLAGLVPALQASRPDLVSALKAGAREGGGHRAGTRSALLVVQTTLAVVLLVGTGLFVRSLRNVTSVPVGTRAERVLMTTLSLRGAGYTQAQTDMVFEQMAERARALPGVASVAIALTVPFSSSWGSAIRIPGRDSVPGAYVNAVTPGFFETIGTRLLRGRDFTESDRQTAQTIVVSARAAQRWWPTQDAVGQCVKLGADTAPCLQVIGVAEDVRKETVLEAEDVLQIYIPLERATRSMSARVLLVRAEGEVGPLIEPLRRAVQTAAPALPYANVRPLSLLLEGEIRPWRLGATMFGTFGLLAVVLVAVGLYGVVSYVVAQRTREMGVRLALGARPADVLRLVVREGIGVTALGAALGIILALVAGRMAQALLFHVSARDPLILLGVVGVVLAVAAMASAVPAWRASRTDPIIALRSD